MPLDDDAGGRTSYWDNYYSSYDRPLIDAPSSFANFVAGEIRSRSTIFEFGCGNGRDSIFLAKSGHELIAVDGSMSAVERLNSKISSEQIPGVKTVCARVDEEGLGRRLIACALQPNRQSLPAVVVYARFFLHALTEDEQAAFLVVSAELLRKGGLLAVEFRTCEDRLGARVTPPHYRRYVDPKAFIQDAARLDLQAVHFEQGRGFARHGVDDAHVARIILRATRGEA